jgi:putative DNA primase/helicase
VNTIKLFTGEDVITTRGLHEKQRRWKPKFKCILVCNDIPRLDENTWAAWRRFKVVPFGVKFCDNPRLPHERAKDPTIGERLTKCRAAFVSILVCYLQRFKTEGLNDSATVREATQQYQSENDVLEEFIEEVLIADAGAALRAADTYEAFKEWAKRKGRKIPDRDRKIIALFSEKFGKPRSVRGSNTAEDTFHGWKGYRL